MAPGVLKARRGALLTTGVTQHEAPLPGLSGERCQLIFLVDSNAWRPQQE